MTTTQSKVFKIQVQQHIKDRLLDADELISGYDISTTPETLQAEQLKAVIREFKNWYHPYEQKRTPNQQEAFKQFLLCLPGCLSVEYIYFNIFETVKRWFIDAGMEYKEPKTDTQEEKAINLYYALIYREFNTLCKQEKLSLF